MTSKHASRRELTFKPLYPVLQVTQESVNEIPQESITSEIVGEKAFGLCCLPKPWTLPFIVVSEELLYQYSLCPKSNREKKLKQWTDRIINATKSVGINYEDPIIVRSSGVTEGLEERGKYCSTYGALNNIQKPLQECLNTLLTDTTLNQRGIPLVVQKYITPISDKGHLSNERRFYKEKRDWLGEYEGTGTPFKINLRNWRKKIFVGDRAEKPLMCNLSAHVSEILKFPARWGYDRGIRLHYEWVWDGKTIYLVQADRERESGGVDPTKLYQKQYSLSEYETKCLIRINRDHAIKFNKIKNVFTYMKLNLPITQLYILDDQSVIHDLASGKVSPNLRSDMSALVKGSLVIRMDIATEDMSKRQLLPRSNEVRTLDKALAWLIEKSSDFKRCDVEEDIAFIFHNFIPSISSAFAYAAPNERKVQIEALWGLPEGLYYNSHDKYIVDTRSTNVKNIKHTDIDRFEVQEELHCKQFFVAPDENGLWTTQILKPPYDWRGSISKNEWIKEIAYESRRIADEEGISLSIMWFVDVNKIICSRPVFPWYHEPYDIEITIRASTHRTKTPFDKSLEIKTNEDLKILRKEAEKPSSSVRRVKIKPREEMLLRNKHTLRMIGELANKIGAVIILEGGVLSHAYYQLMKTDAVVEVKHPFEGYEDKREFYKLVRDKVPQNIESGGELVTKMTLSGEAFLRALREKLVEESLEVLDAKDQEAIIGELADLNEVIDGILNLLNVGRDELIKRQNNKREKAGGFKEGLVLLKTSNPLPTKKISDNRDYLLDNLGHRDTVKTALIDDQKVIEDGHKVDSWVDRREHQTSIENLMRLTVPMVMDNWIATTRESFVDDDSDHKILARITGKRLGSKLRIELSILTPLKQLKLFSN